MSTGGRHPACGSPPPSSALGWGSAKFGTLGTGYVFGVVELAISPVRAAASPLDDYSWIEIVAGSEHSAALRANGTVWAWGHNVLHQLGNESTAVSYSAGQVLMIGHVPAERVPFDHVIALAAGANHTLALRADGTVWAWGDDSYGQLGGNRGAGSKYLALPMLSGGIASNVQEFLYQRLPTRFAHVIALAAGRDHSLVLTSDGRVYACGRNNQFQLGNGTTLDSPFLIAVLDASGNPLDRVKAIAAGGNHSLALRADGTVVSWGSNGFGELGRGVPKTDGPRAEVIEGLAEVVAIACGGFHGLALRADGSVWAWGMNGRGQLGDWTKIDHLNPAAVKSLGPAKAIQAGGLYSLALLADGTVSGWGANSSGQLGAGAGRSDSTEAVEIKRSDGTSLVATSIATGESHAFALALPPPLGRDEGMAPDPGSYEFTWGGNEHGQLGMGDRVNRGIPAQVAWTSGGGDELLRVVAVTGGVGRTFAISDDGRIFCQGNGSYLGILPDGGDKLRPVVTLLESGRPFDTALQVACGRKVTLALRADGTVWGWGYNREGPLPGPMPGPAWNPIGRPTEDPQEIYGNPAQGAIERPAIGETAPRVPSIVSLSVADRTTAALSPNGEVWIWGAAINKEYGSPAVDWHPPIRVGGPAWKFGLPSTLWPPRGALVGDVKEIAAGNICLTMLTVEGRLLVWGDPRGGDLAAKLTTPGWPTLVSDVDPRDPPITPKDADKYSGHDELRNVKAIASSHTPDDAFEGVGTYVFSSFTIALLDDGTVVGWGNNGEGELGTGEREPRLSAVDYPRHVLAGPYVRLTGIKAIAAGERHALALDASGQVWVWGMGGAGRLGDGDTSEDPTHIDTVARPVPEADPGYPVELTFSHVFGAWNTSGGIATTALPHPLGKT